MRARLPQRRRNPARSSPTRRNRRTGAQVTRNGEQIVDTADSTCWSHWLQAASVFLVQVLNQTGMGYRHPADTGLVNVHVQRLRGQGRKRIGSPTVVLTVQWGTRPDLRDHALGRSDAGSGAERYSFAPTRRGRREVLSPMTQGLSALSRAVAVAWRPIAAAAGRGADPWTVAGILAAWLCADQPGPPIVSPTSRSRRRSTESERAHHRRPGSSTVKETRSLDSSLACAARSAFRRPRPARLGSPVRSVAVLMVW